MAKKPNRRLSTFLSTMAGGFSTLETIGKVTLDTDGATSISNAERAELIERISQSTGTENTRRSANSYNKYIRPLTHQIARTKLDNEALRVLAPEIRAAETIVIPSIMSPTDLRDNEITITSNSPLVDKTINEKISELLDNHFNKQMHLSIKLPEWIREALYGAGSKPLLVLPITELDTIMNDPTAILSKTITTAYSTEALKVQVNKLSNIVDLEAISIFGLADSSQEKPTKKDALPIDIKELRPSLESVIVDFANESGFGPNPDEKNKTSYNLALQFKEKDYPELKAFATEAIEGISIIDNSDVLKSDKVKKKNKQRELTEKIVFHYKTKDIITINPETGPSQGNPVVYELPPESVIPVFTPGAPTDHIGYFVCIDEFGNPIHVDEKESASLPGDNRRTSPGSLYSSFGVDKHFYRGDGTPNRNEKDALMVSVYQTVIEAHLRQRLKNSGFDNMYIGATENVYRCMFARYLAERKTKLLFIPKDFMTYFCFKHNSDGTGRSQIEDIKFILSLKITILICRMMASMNSAINRKKININFTPEMGDPIQYIEMLKKEAIDKSIVNFTYDPSEITRTLAQRALTVSAKGIPGAENFDISTEPNEYRNITPDDTLMEELSNMLILTLDTPPSAMNALSENEYSRTVATNNLYFSRKTAAKQKIVCKLVARHIQIYIQFSQTLKEDIKKILHLGVEGLDKSTPKESGTVEDHDESLDAKIADIIKHIKTSLPASEVAPNKTEFEELDAMIASINTAVEGIFDPKLASEDPIEAVQALIKSDLIRGYMKRIGISKDTDIPDIDTSLLNQMVQFRHKVANTKKALQDITTNTTAVPPDSTGGNGSPGTTPDDTGGAPTF